MGCPTRRFITEPERQQIFDRWFKGESQYSIARSLGRGHTSIQGVLSRTGGIRPIMLPGIERTDPRPVNWHRTVRLLASWPASYSLSGHRDKSQGG